MLRMLLILKIAEINHLIYMDDMELFKKFEKELKTVTQTIRIYNQIGTW